MTILYIYLVGFVITFFVSYGIALYKHYVKGIKNHNLPVNSKRAYQYYLVLGVIWFVLVITFVWGGIKGVYNKVLSK